MQKNTSGYSVIVAILMVGFLLIISAGVFQLVLSELKDNTGRENYIKASAGAEGALELALLEIKEKGYGYYGKVESGDSRSLILADGVSDPDLITGGDSVFLYTSDSRVNQYNGTLSPTEFDIIPLFYLDDSSNPEKKVQAIELSSTSGASSISWNIVSEDGGISGQGVFNSSTLGIKRVISSGVFDVSSVSVGDFLSGTTQNNYLILLNSDPATDLEYTLIAPNPDEFFTKPRTEIISSAKIGNYTQNFRTIVDNTEFLNLLKYSIFSN